MSLQQVIQPRSASNGFGRRRAKEDFGPKIEGKLQHVKADSNIWTSAGQGGGGSRELLVYLTTCLIGHNVEVQVLDGSVFSGIFHAADAEKDFGIILKMARLIKDCSRRQKGTSDIVIGPPTKTMIIPAKELVQITAKDVPVTRSGLVGELQCDKQQELLIDSSISKSRLVDSGRELERWVPDDDDVPGCPELENIFDGHWNRGWDQFEVNESLFGVKSTFVEELYTTKLDKGPQMKELEREAIRIAKEIEGETTYDLHLAEERGMIINDNLEIDEETRFSSVFRGVDDSGYDDSDDILLDAQNDKTFEGGYSSAVGKSIAELSSWKPTDGSLASTRPFVDAEHPSQSTSSVDLHESGSDDHARPLSSGQASKNALHPGDNTPCENQIAEHTINNHSEGDVHAQSDVTQSSKPDESQSLLWPTRDSSDKIGLSASATAYAPSGGSSKGREKTSYCNDPAEGTKSSKAQVASQSVISHVRPSSSASSTSEFGSVPTASRVLSPSSSVGSLSSEKSTLNPNAKEFKLNPNAKSFLPSQTQLRPASPVSDGSFYYQGNVGSGTHMTSLPMGIGIGPSFAPTPPVVFNPPSGPPPPQPYFHPNGPQLLLQYGQHMMIGQPRQLFYMPTYAPDMHYKGRDF